MDISEGRRAFERYLTAWSAIGAEERQRVLVDTVSSEIDYFDAKVRLSVRDALGSHLTGFQQRRPNYSFSLAQCLQHNDAVLANWLIKDDGGKVLVGGFDSVRLDAERRIASVVGFFDIRAQSGK